MRLTFLGTGNAGQVPVYGCECPACQRAHRDPRWRRGPSCVLVEAAGQRILLDAGLMDLAERFPPGSLSHILLTHYHADHVQGLFRLRWGVNTEIRITGPADVEGCADLQRTPGILTFTAPARPFETLVFGDLEVTPVPLTHSRPTLGYRLRHEPAVFAYLTDTAGLAAETLAFLAAPFLDLLVLDCSHSPSATPARNHNDLPLALEIAAHLRPRRTLLTHVGHEVDAWLMGHADALPADVAVARDGQKVSLWED